MGEKILIVEDDLSISDLYKNELSNLGYKVFTAYTGGEGLALAKKVKPNLILADIMMPGMDGFNFIRNVRDNAEIAATPIIVLTNLGTSKIFTDEGKRLGVKKYIVKYKMSLAEVVKNIGAVLNEKK